MQTPGPWAIEYEVTGRPQDPAILLLMGLGMQLTSWPEAFCQALVDAGFRVVRMDNRDSGLSTYGTAAPGSRLGLALAASFFGLPVRSPYTLQDMAQDAIGVLDELHIYQAHVVGISMGGMIAQVMAAQFPQRVRSLCSVMSSSGNRWVSQPSTRALKVLLSRPQNPHDPSEVVNHLMHLFSVIGSSAYPESPDSLRERITKGVQRACSPPGTTRQLLAILASGDRRKLLRTIRVPTLVIHGSADPLVPLAAGRDTAANVPGAAMSIIKGMGHDLPTVLLPQLAQLVVSLCVRAQELALPPPLPTLEPS